MKIIQIVAMEKVSTIGNKTINRTVVYGLSDEGIMYEMVQNYVDNLENSGDGGTYQNKWRKMLTSEDINNDE